ncbi:MAG: thiaminase II [Mycobacterium sp.]
MVEPIPTTHPPLTSWSTTLWLEIQPIFDAIVAHPFVIGLTDGTLDPDVFAHYVAQDVHYLRDYAKAIALVGARCPLLADTAMFARHAADIVDVELSLHSGLLPELGLSSDDLMATSPAPTTRAYTTYLLATAYEGHYSDGLAALVPCYWIYAQVGRHLVERGSPDARYQRWIDTYSGEDYAATVNEVLEFVDRTGLVLSDLDEARARAHFVTTARYEWMFFDAAYRREVWPV